MNKFKEKVIQGKEFIIACEFVPGRWCAGRTQGEVGLNKKFEMERRFLLTCWHKKKKLAKLQIVGFRSW